MKLLRRMKDYVRGQPYFCCFCAVWEHCLRPNLPLRRRRLPRRQRLRQYLDRPWMHRWISKPRLPLRPMIWPRVIPGGIKTGTVSDVVASDSKKGLTLADVVNQVGQNRIAINFVWTLITGFLVMFMQAGFAIVETGLCRAKNANHTMMMNFMVYGFGLFAYWVCGFAIQMGGRSGTVSTAGWGFNPLNSEYTIHLLGYDWGLFGTHGLLPERRVPMMSASWSSSCSKWSSWIRR